MNNDISQAINNPVEFKHTYYISKSWEIFFKAPWLFIGALFVEGLISFSLSIVPVLGSIASAIFSSIFMGGIYIVAKKINNNEHVEFSDFFSAFKKIEKLAPIIIVSFLFLVLAFILLIIPGIYLSIAYWLVIPIAIFCDEDLMNTLEASRKIVSKQWFSFLGFFLLLVLFNIAGLLCLVVGLFVTIPISMITTYVIFDDLIKTSSKDTFTQSTDLLDDNI